MGSESSTTNLKAGKEHSDTTTYKDSDSLSQGNLPKKITKIRVWWSEFMVGFEAFYDGNSAGARKGSGFKDSDPHVDFDLSEDEHISEISGRSGDVIDTVTFHTNKGRTQKFGDSTGGEEFSLKEDGKVVKSFTVGFGEHMHFIEGHFGEDFAEPQKSQIAGKSHDDTTTFDDKDSHLTGKSHFRITELKVLHDNNMVFGIQAVYSADGDSVDPGVHAGNEMNSDTKTDTVSVPDGKHITGISGRSGDVINQLKIQLSDGSEHTFGGSDGSEFNNIVPHGKKVVALGGGLGGHLHNIFCYYN